MPTVNDVVAILTAAAAVPAAITALLVAVKGLPPWPDRWRRSPRSAAPPQDANWTSAAFGVLGLSVALFLVVLRHSSGPDLDESVTVSLSAIVGLMCVVAVGFALVNLIKRPKEEPGRLISACAGLIAAAGAVLAVLVTNS
ncbi:MAG TPA: hypothetical protein VF755_13640 [Catenuloplanes sp.]|jgi:preprotein translocase subunit Sss1